MVSKDLLGWFREGPGLIARGPGRGLFQGEAEVPSGLQALHTRQDSALRENVLLPSGNPFPEDALLVRSADLPVAITVPRLRDCNGFLGSFVLTVKVTPPTSPTAALLLRDRGLKGAERFGAVEVAEFLQPAVRRQLDLLLTTSSWDGDGGVIERFRVDGFVASFLAEPLFELGLTLRGVSGFAVDSETLEEHRQRESEVRREAERIQNRLEFLELWKKEEMGEALAHAEVKKLASHLRREGLLQELEKEQEIASRRLEAQEQEAKSRGQLRRMLERERIATQSVIEEEKLEFEIERARQLKEVLEQHGLLAVAGQLSDSPHAERLLELLVEKEMTPEQIAARTDQRNLARLEERFQALATELRTDGPRPSSAFAVEQLAPIDQIWVAAGLSLYRISGDGAFGQGNPTPVLPPEDIGYLRSVSISENDASVSDNGVSGTGPAILVGAQAGVAVYRPSGSYWSVHRYRPQPKGRGGANAVMLASDRILATHSELGLHAWPATPNSSSAPMFPDRVTPGRSTRGILRGPGGRVYFAHRETIYCIDSARPSELVSCGDLPDSVTALGSTDDQLMAGTRDGRLFLWRPGEVWQEAPFRTGGPVFRIACLNREGTSPGKQCGWVVGARQPAVHILDAAGHLVEEYRTRYPIRWVAAGRQGVLGVDRFGQELLLWRWGEHDAPYRRIRVPDQIQYFAASERREIT